MRSILMCLVFLCSLSAAAQDVMNLTGVAAIHYENGEKTFNTVAEQSSSSNEQFVFNRESQYIDDGALLAMAEIKKLKRRAWIGGGIMMGIGVPMLGIGAAWIGAGDGHDESFGNLLLIPGAIFTAAGIGTAAGCLTKANKLKKQITNRVVSAPMWQNDFQLHNNATLSTQICTIQDVQQKAPTLGFGLSYQF